MALNVTPEQLQISLPADKTKVFGVLMDWDFGDRIATFVSFSNGEASMYLSTGGGVIGAGEYKNVSKVAKAFVEMAQKKFDKVTKIDSTPLPDKSCVRFYFMTNKGKFTAQEDLKNFNNKSSIWLPLFEEGNKLILELKSIQEKK